MSSSSPSSPVPGGYREVLQVALPLIISMGSFTVMQFCDRIFLSWYSPLAIQAALPAGVLAFTLGCGFMELAGYANTFVAQHFGAGDRKGCSRSAAQAVFIALASWPLLWLLIPVGRGILQVVGHQPEVLALELEYLTILLAGGVTIPLGMATATFFTGRGDTRTTMMANVVGNVVNIFLDYALIFGAWGFPEWGIRGAAVATVISGFIIPAILMAIFFSRRYAVSHDTRRQFRPHLPLMARIIRFGFPSSVHLVLDVSSFSMFVLLVGRLGPLALTTTNIAFSINLVAFLPLIGLGVTATTLVGRYQGRERPDLAERAAWTTYRVGVYWALAVGLTYVLFPGTYFGLFQGSGPDAIPLADMLPLGRKLLFMMFLWGVLDAGNIIVSGALKGAGDTRFVMFYSVAMGWGVFVLGEVLILLVFDGNILHAWSWMTFYIMLLVLGYVLRFRSGLWKIIDVLGRRSAAGPLPRHQRRVG